MTNAVTAVRAADPATAHAAFAARLALETDPSDVATALAAGDPGFVVVDTRSPDAYAAGHIPGAVNLALPFSAKQVAALGGELVVVYCWGPGCNGATKAAARLAELGLPVKEMLGGFEYWVREGHPVDGTAADDLRASTDNRGLVGLPYAVSCLC